MSVLNKIREKSTLLLITVGGALVLFIVGDILTSSTSVSNRSRNEVGEVAGKPITGEEFEFRLQKAEEGYKQNSGQPTIDDATRDMLRQQTWNQVLNEIIMDREYEEIGLAVSTQELYDMVRGKDPHPSVRQAFTNPQTGGFDQNAVQRFLKTMDEDETGQTKARWVNFESALKREKLNEKYNNLIKKGLYVTTNLAKRDYLGKNTNAKFRYVAKHYNTIPDSSIAVTEDDLEDYLKEHKKEYKQEASRKVEYVVFDVAPSQQDMDTKREELTGLANEFKITEDDSLFVAINSDNPAEPAYYTKNTLPAGMDSSLFNMEKGTVIGPYQEGSIFKLAKIADVKMSPDSVKARHILIKITAPTDSAAAFAKADSLKKLIRGGQKFEDLARVHSEDLGSATQGGDLGWFSEGMMVKPFNDAAFNGKKGDLVTVESQFGVHLIEVLDKSSESKKVKIAFIDRQIDPSAGTFQQVYAKAADFAAVAKNEEKFDKAVESQNLNKQIAENVKEGDRNLMDIEGSREIVRWIYEADKGDVSKPYEFNNRFVIAVVKDIREEGYASVENVRPQLEIAVRKEKKAQRFMEEFNSAINVGAKTLDALAGKTSTTIEPVESINFAAFAIPGAGREPAVIGTVFGINKGALSEPVKGQTGVFVLTVDNIIPAPATTDYTQNKAELTTMLGNRVNYEVFEALKESAKIKDNLAKFY